MRTTTVKEQAKSLLDELPDDATWDELMYRIYVRQKIAEGLQDLDEGRTHSQEEIERLFPDR